MSNKNFGKIGVLMGGYSSEREISLKSGNAIYKALKDEGLDVIPIDIKDKDEVQIFSLILGSKLDIAFIAIHGALGEDGLIQTILEKANITYTGSGIEASKLAINKARAQNIFSLNGINIPNHVILKERNDNNINIVKDKLNSLPFVVKPSNEGSSIGISIVKNEKELDSALNTAFNYGNEVIVEEYIIGREMTVGILDSNALPVIEIVPKSTFFDFNSKYQAGMSDYIVPAEISKKVSNKLKEAALKAHNVLGCCDFSRVDFILDRNSQEYMLEVNTIPGFTSTSLLPKAAKEVGINFNQLCVKIIELAYGKKKETKDILFKS